MNGLGGLNKSPNGVVIGLVQLQLPVVATKADLARQTERIVWMVGKARRNLATMDLVVFPEYSLHGLSMDTNPEIMCRLDGPEVAAFRQACIDNKIWGCFSIMEFNPHGNPYNSGLIIDDHGEIKLYYRKFHPWIPVEPWEPGDIGIPVIDGPKGAKIALIICHFQHREMAKLASKGREDKAQAVEDKVQTLMVIIDNLQETERTVPGLLKAIQDLFTDNGGGGMLTLATVHKAKGLEWGWVYLLGYHELMPSKWARKAWQKEQERNLIYVGMTRARQELYFVPAPAKRGRNAKAQ